MYRINVWVRAASPGLYGNAWGTWDAYNATLTYTLAPGCAAVSDSASPAGGAMKGMTVDVTAAAAGCFDPQPQYEFWVLAPGASLYTLAQPYSTSATLHWSTNSLAPGAYRINVWTRDAASPGAFGNAWGTWDAYNATLTYTVTAGCPAVAVSASGGPRGPAVFSAAAPGCPNPLYEFWILSPGASLYTLVQPYGPASTFTWSTAGNGPGGYRVDVWVRDAASLGVFGNAYGRWDEYNAGLVYTVG